MPIVADANLLVPLAVDDARATMVNALLHRSLAAGETLHAPTLLPYEVANALTRLVAAGMFPAERIPEAWQAVLEVPITYHSLEAQGVQMVDMARRLRRASAYDAAYLVLAEQLGAELWTFDGPLARNAAALGFPVHLVG